MDGQSACRCRDCRRLASEPLPAAPEAPIDQPAMFVVRDADTTIYIFGTFHALDGRSQWFGEPGPRRLRAGG